MTPRSGFDFFKFSFFCSFFDESDLFRRAKSFSWFFTILFFSILISFLSFCIFASFFKFEIPESPASELVLRESDAERVLGACGGEYEAELFVSFPLFEIGDGSNLTSGDETLEDDLGECL